MKWSLTGGNRLREVVTMREVTVILRRSLKEVQGKGEGAKEMLFVLDLDTVPCSNNLFLEVRSTLTLQTPLYYGHSDNTNSS